VPVLERLEDRVLPSNITLVPVAGTNALAPGVVGQAYSQNITALGGNGDYTFTFPAGGIDGLTFVQHGATLTLQSPQPPPAQPTPTSAGSFPFTVTATDTAGDTSGPQQYTLIVSAQPLTVNLTQLPAATVGVQYDQTITASGGTAPYQFIWPAITSMNTGNFGLTFTPPNGSANLVLSGIPMTPGTFPINVEVTDNFDSNTNTFNDALVERYLLTVNSAAAGPLNLTLASSTANGLPPATFGTQYTQTLTASGGSGKYNITVSQKNLGGLSFAVAGANVTLSGIPTATGSFAFHITVADANNPSMTLTQPYTLVINPTGITIVPSILPPATQNQLYLPKEPDPASSFTQNSNESTTRPVQLSASGGSGVGYDFSATGIPPGMTFSSNGVLGGTPAVSGSFNIQVTATDSDGNKAPPISFPFTVSPLTVSHGSAPANYSPAQVLQAYGLKDIVLSGGVLGTGANQTIVITEQGDNPNFVSSIPAYTIPSQGSYADSDVAQFDAKFGLTDFDDQPGQPVFLKLDATGKGTNYPAEGGAVELSEFSEDVEWAHAVAPMANIVVIEDSDVLGALKTAVNWTSSGLTLPPGISVPLPTVVSHSGYAFFDQSGESANDSIFRTPANQPGISIVISSGDEAAFGGGFSQQQTLYGGVEYPATSPNVLAAGETLLATNSAGDYEGEEAFVNSGGGISMFETQPSFQSGVVNAYSTTGRTTPDVSIIGASASPVSVYNSAAPNGPWIEGFGTSLAAPIWAGLIAIIDQGRVAAGKGTLESYTQAPNDGYAHLLPMLYQLPATDFNAITQLSNGVAIPPGYNVHTGLGSPVANLLAPDMIGGHNTISGTLTNSVAGGPLIGWTVFLDTNGSGVYQQGVDAATTTDANGNYSFVVAPGDKYRVRVQPPAGWQQTSANPAPFSFATGQNQTQAGVNFTFTSSTATGLIAVGAGPGGGPEVKVYNAQTQALLLDFFAYSPSFTGGVQVALGDLSGNGVPDIIVGAGPGGGSDVRIFNGQTGAPIGEFSPFNPLFTGGQFIAAGDLSGQGYDDIIVGADYGGGPNVIVFDGKTGAVLYNFFAYDPAFIGGVRVAAGDVLGNGQMDIICGAGPGGGPNVTVFQPNADGTVTQVSSFFAYNPAFNLGIYVAAGDVQGNGKDQIITGAGAGGGPNVLVFDGSDGALIASFFAYDPGFVGGVRVAAAQQSNGTVVIVTAAGPAGGAQVTEFSASGTAIDSFFAYNPLFNAGLWVAGA
jgi:hypothetical protein